MLERLHSEERKAKSEVAVREQAFMPENSNIKWSIHDVSVCCVL